MKPKTMLNSITIGNSKKIKIFQFRLKQINLKLIHINTNLKLIYRYHSRNFDSYKNRNIEKADNDGKNSDRYPNSVARTSQYLLSSKFFAECRNIVKKNEYDVLIDTLKSFNKNDISKNEAFDRIGKVLEPYQKLFRDFRSIFLK